MSVDYSIYLGPYAKCKISDVESTQTVRRCGNPKCAKGPTWGDYGFGAFCAYCGAEIVNSEIKCVVEQQHWSEISELLNERLCCGMEVYEGGYHIWYSNIHCDFGLLVEFGDFPIDRPVLPFHIRDETDKFCSLFEKELDILRQQYGAEKVSVQWGLIGFSG